MCLAFSLFHPPAAQIDCCVTGFTGLNLQNIFARFTWLFGKCEQSVDILVFCWNLKGEQFLTSYFPLSLLIIYILFNYWLMNKLTVKRMCHKFVGMLHAHGMASAEQYNQSIYNTKSHTRLAHYAQEQHNNKNNLHFTSWKPFRMKIVLFVHQLPMWTMLLLLNITSL